ncbi:histidine kinase [Clostridium felsineum]|uniref:sensor histidine kinase n=1 Tax=Clostridium felsineum TaxID=36839 RepID=UPI00214DC262|nr:histidine kinase [Clostridium felsineum]MCR3761808.1 histidine kinase [Clostridium felsineum]
MRDYIILFIKNVRDFFIKKNLMKKLIITYILVIAVPIMFFSVYTFKSLEVNAKKDAINKHSYELNVEYSDIEKNIYIMRNVLSAVKNNEDVMNYIDPHKSTDLKELIKFNDVTYKEITNLQNNNPNIRQINIFTNNSEVNEIWPLIYSEKRIIGDKWYKNTLDKDGAAYWNINQCDNDIKKDSLEDQDNGELIVSLNKEIKSQSSKDIGIIRITMLSKNFFPNMFNNDKLNNSQIFIFNTRTLDLITNENNIILKRLHFDRNLFKKSIMGKLKDSKGDISYSQGNEKYILLYMESPLASDYLICVIPLNNITKSVAYSRKALLSESLLLLLLLSIIIYFVTKIILKRLYLILNSIRQIRTGNLEVDIPVYGSDEIGVLAHNFREMMKKIDELIKENIKKEVIGKETELRALKSQINAHFLFNTLENIRVMSLVEGNYVVADSLVSLADMMRYNIKWDNDFVSLNEELNHIKKYISLMTLRYEYCINLHVDIDENFCQLKIPKLIIQPLVENAVNHGLREKLRKKDGNIYISVREDGDYLNLNVMDDGKGMNKDEIHILYEHINGKVHEKLGLGIKNVNDRIRLFYGKNSGVYIEAEKESYSKFIIKLYNKDENSI